MPRSSIGFMLATKSTNRMPKFRCTERLIDEYDKCRVCVSNQHHSTNIPQCRAPCYEPLARFVQKIPSYYGDVISMLWISEVEDAGFLYLLVCHNMTMTHAIQFCDTVKGYSFHSLRLEIMCTKAFGVICQAIERGDIKVTTLVIVVTSADVAYTDAIYHMIANLKHYIERLTISLVLKERAIALVNMARSRPRIMRLHASCTNREVIDPTLSVIVSRGRSLGAVFVLMEKLRLPVELFRMVRDFLVQLH